ncbi:MAG: zinc-binding dehydrogenase [Proteobacteria bacterium]|nr:zinc-binding dehydrogenase [Pseudomonadota bacterium]
MVRKFRPVLDALEASMSGELGEPVHIKMHVAGDYEAGIEDLVTGAVDFARFGPASYVLAKERNPELRILAVDVVESKLALARELGATDVIDSTATDPVARIHELTDGGAHYTFDAIGLADVSRQAFDALRPGGTATIRRGSNGVGMR